MGDKYQCKDCEEYFKAYQCRECKIMIHDRCYWCHFDFMNEQYGLFGSSKKEAKEGTIHV